MPVELILAVVLLTATAIASALTLWVVRLTVHRRARRSGSAAGARGVWWVAGICFIPALSAGVFAGYKLDYAFWVALTLSQQNLIPVVFAIATGLAAGLLMCFVSTLAAVLLMRSSTSAKVAA